MTSCSTGGAGETSSDPSGREPGFFTRTLDTFRGSPSRIGEIGQVSDRVLAIDMEVSPDPVSLRNTRRLDVTIRARNTSRRIQNLHFPTAQRIEIQLVDESGAVVTRWSEDRVFAQILGNLTINPGEQIEFAETISTRDLAAGKTYTLEAFFPGQDGLPVVRKPVTPIE